MITERYEVRDEREEEEKVKELSERYGMWNVYCFHYEGNDGKFHREVFVNEDNIG